MSRRLFVGLLALLASGLSAESLSTPSGPLPLHERPVTDRLSADAGLWELGVPVAVEGSAPVLWAGPAGKSGQLEAFDASGRSLARTSWSGIQLSPLTIGLALPPGSRLASFRLVNDQPAAGSPRFRLSRLGELHTTDSFRLVPEAGNLRVALSLPPLPAGQPAVLWATAAPSTPGEIVATWLEGNKKQSRRLGLGPGAASLAFYPPAQKPYLLDLQGPGLERLALRLYHTDAHTPLPADLGQLLVDNEVPRRQASHEWFSWRLFPEVLILESADYRVQDRYFLRLAFFVEKAGYRGTLMNNQQLAGRHGWNAHDYRPEDLAAFFNLAETQNFPLNPEETELRNQLVASGILQGKAPGLQPGQGAVLGFSRQSAPALRRLLLTHEAAHGVFFVRPAFRQACERVWNSLSPEAQDLWKAFMVQADYDPEFEYLMRNELMAYALQQPAGQWQAFLQSRVFARSVARFPERKAEWTARFGPGGRNMDEFVDAFRQIEAALQAEAPIAAGQFSLWEN